MRTEATVRVTLNKGLGGEHGHVAVTYDSRAEMAPYFTPDSFPGSTVFRKEL